MPVVGLWPSGLRILAKNHFLNIGLNNLHFIVSKTCEKSEGGGPRLKSAPLFADKVLRNGLHGVFRGRSRECLNRVRAFQWGAYGRSNGPRDARSPPPINCRSHSRECSLMGSFGRLATSEEMILLGKDLGCGSSGWGLLRFPFPKILWMTVSGTSSSRRSPIQINLVQGSIHAIWLERGLARRREPFLSPRTDGVNEQCLGNC